MIDSVVLGWLLAAAILALPTRWSYFPAVLRRLFGGLSSALVIASVVLVSASFIYAWPDCAEVPWWVLWCDWNNANP